MLKGMFKSHTDILKMSVIFNYFICYVNIIVTFFIRNPYFCCVFIMCVRSLTYLVFHI